MKPAINIIIFFKTAYTLYLKEYMFFMSLLYADFQSNIFVIIYLGDNIFYSIYMGANAHIYPVIFFKSTIFVN